jgi:hypothetical protein
MVLLILLREPQLCGIDKHLDHPVHKIKSNIEGRALRSSEWQPLRIHIEYISMNVSSEQQDILQNQIIPGAVQYWESALNVKRSSGNLILNGTDECIYVTVPDEHKTEGVDADVILYVTSGSNDPSVVGWAAYCVQDLSTGQPVAGQFHIDTTLWDTFTTEDLLSVTIHELAHALAFNPNLFSSWVKPNGVNYNINEVYSVATVRGKEVVTLITPRVQAAARSHFNCSTLNGVELESSGGPGTAGAHWEKRIMYNEFMTGDTGKQDVVYSKITLALFEDSGWYKPNYDYTTALIYGKSQGCDFITTKCVVNSVPQFDVFCNNSTQQPACDFQHLSKGTCNLADMVEPIPSEYQYFGTTTRGGTDLMIDYCPVVKAYSYGNCRGIGIEQTYLASNYGEKACENCRCIEGTFNKSGEVSVHATCHEIECFDTYALVNIGDVQVQCPFIGGSVKAKGYEGYVNCPDSSILCDPMPCMNNCYGIGFCKQGVCQCDDGSTGGDCSETDGIWSLTSSGREMWGVGALLILSIY